MMSNLLQIVQKSNVLKYGKHVKIDDQRKDFLYLYSLYYSLQKQNNKKQTGTDVPPPTWTHPDYFYNENSIITQLREVQQVSEAAKQAHLS